MVVKKDQQYTFQIILPKKLFEETFLTGFLLRNNESSNFIRKLWWKEGERSGEYIPDSEISVETIKLSNNRELIIIELPEVTEELESKYVGIVLDYVKFTPYFIKRIRYFTPMYVFDETSNRYVWLLSEIIASDEDFKVEAKSHDLLLEGSKESLINWVRNNIDHKPIWKPFENPEIDRIQKIEDTWEKLDYVWVDDTFLTYLGDSFIDLNKEFRKIINDLTAKTV